jgi:hypothetical protein
MSGRRRWNNYNAVLHLKQHVTIRNSKCFCCENFMIPIGSDDLARLSTLVRTCSAGTGIRERFSFFFFLTAPPSREKVE